ncbi:hypothetical protein WMY93_015228 [Mugilogobius chulae]|uniref:Uncharacterized protein n=1 Tax=Mugilogobius chulae TaxID=88201 RepID=A0AAW0NZV3_9GOBI
MFSEKRQESLAADLTKDRKTSVKHSSEKESQQKPPSVGSTSDSTQKKKTGQKYFQCVYVPGKGGAFPRRPFTPAMPVMMSPAFRSMLEQHERESGRQ